MMHRNVILAFVLLIVAVVSSYASISSQHDHLIVLSNGLMGYSSDLNNLANLLRSNGCVVLQSQSNQYDKSLHGIAAASARLVDEIFDIHRHNPQLKRISFVGNSLGGLFSRYTISLLKNVSTTGLLGLEAYKFMTIATPHLGVRDYTFLDEVGIKLPYIAKSLFSSTLSKSGNELFLADDSFIMDSLLYKMATLSEFLEPLRMFQSRRLYANLKNDFVVPLGTAAFLSSSHVDHLRKKHQYSKGIVEVLPPRNHGNMVCDDNDDITCIASKYEHKYIHEYEMMQSLNSVGWEKIIVSFGLSLGLPFAHNKICALAPGPKLHPIAEKVLKFNEGVFVMENATAWLTAE